MVRRILIVLIAGLIATGLSVCVHASPSSAATTGKFSKAKAESLKSKVHSRLLTITDLPSGWNVDNTNSKSGNLTNSKCLSTFKRSNKKFISATVDFAQNSNVPVLDELLATGSGVNSAYKKATKSLSSCKRLTLKSNGTMLHGTIGQLSFPTVGTQSKAYALGFTIKGIHVGFDLVMFRVHKYVGLVAYADIGTPDVTTAESLVKKAVAKVSAGASASGNKASQAKGPVGSVGDPVPVGQASNVGGWSVSLASVAPWTPGPTTGFNTPTPGYTFEVYKLHATRVATKAAAPSTSLDVVLVGPSKAERSVDSNPMCDGGTPDNNDVLKGGSVTFGSCISVPSSDAGHLMLGVTAYTTFNNNTPIWFAVPGT